MTKESDALAERDLPCVSIDFANWTYNTTPERTGNEGWTPDLQDLIYTAINHVEGDYEDADENCAEQVIERLVLAIKTLLSQREASRPTVSARYAEMQADIAFLNASNASLTGEVSGLYDDVAALSSQLEEAKTRIGKLSRCLLPVWMGMAEAELAGEPIPDSGVVLHFMGSGASDQVTAGEIRAALAQETDNGV